MYKKNIIIHNLVIFCFSLDIDSFYPAEKATLLKTWAYSNSMKNHFYLEQKIVFFYFIQSSLYLFMKDFEYKSIGLFWVI